MFKPALKAKYEMFNSSLSSKLTRESGTDFPIPAVAGMGDSETEKLIREKDEEVRHTDHNMESHQHHERDREREPEHNYEHLDAQSGSETLPHLDDEAL